MVLHGFGLVAWWPGWGVDLRVGQGWEERTGRGGEGRECGGVGKGGGCLIEGLLIFEQC